MMTSGRYELVRSVNPENYAVKAGWNSMFMTITMLL